MPEHECSWLCMGDRHYIATPEELAGWAEGQDAPALDAADPEGSQR